MVNEAALPYLVQCWHKGQVISWATDETFLDLDKAKAHAMELHSNWNRKVRIVDQEERILYKLPVDRRDPSQRRRRVYTGE